MKKALVTGASGGIGLVFAAELSKLNYAVTIVARQEEQLAKAIQSFKGSGHKYIKADLATEGGIQLISRVC